MSFDKEEPTTNLITWVFDEGTFSIISDYLGTPILSFDEKGNKVWERELDIYGNVRKGDSHFIPFLYQGQYYDEETGLAYNRFRYYNPETGGYISQDPIGLAGGMPNMYSYVPDANSQFDPFGEKIWSYGNMPKINGMELHHVIPKSLKNHDILKAIGYDVNKVNSLIYLPKEFGGYRSRSTHKGWSGDHSKI